ncbi:molybdopterin-dependent oxidoreductase [Ferroacidibacillus organovorans]|uniref:molybdopterin-dependent oxidoreductase n=1 Tax=Ferroacidibacillus organovorans TaxID=1765683 RepID=UPI0009E9B492|nr:molybdopterin-dependent oxidoreductase [Ferroacidibacillus organovorans]
MAWETERIDQNIYSQGEPEKWIYSTCNICSIGCGCHIAVRDDKIVGIRGNPEHPVNRGRLGPKGEHQWYANNSSDRLRSPLIRNRSGQLVCASWDDAMDLLVAKSKEALQNLGPNGIAIYSTGQGFLEDYYTLAKIGRAGLRSHLMDANTRLCTATTEWCLLQSFGSDGVPASFDDVDLADTVVLFGHNAAETGTVFFERILDRKLRTGKPYLIVVDPRRTLTARAADLFLQLQPGTNLPLLQGLLHIILRNGWIDHDFIARHTVGFEQMRASTAAWTPERVSSLTGLPLEQIEETARHVGLTSRLVCTTLQGTYQSSDATSTCIAINNLHLIRGLIGKPGCGPLHMAGQPSSSTNRTVGGVGTYPGNRNSSNLKHIEEIARLWNVSPSLLEIGPEAGIEEIVHTMESGQLGLFWNIHTNPMVSLPNRQRARKAFLNTFIVVQDAFLTETTEVADLVLPTAMWGEKEGLMENADRMINLSEIAVTPPPGVKADFYIFLDYAKRMGFKDKDGQPLITYKTPRECFEEWKIISAGRPCDMTAMSYEKIKSRRGMRWPANAEHPEGATRLYTDFQFHTNVDDTQSYGKDTNTGRSRTRREFEALHADGRAILYALTYYPPVERPTQEFPLWLTTGRLLWHWHTRTKTGRAPTLQMAASNAYVEIHPNNAARLGIIPGEMVEVVSPRSSIQVPARIVDSIREGVVFVPFHFGSWQSKEAANELTVDFTDPVSLQPQFKLSSCRIHLLRKRYTGQHGESFEKVALSNKLTTEQLALANAMMPPYRIEPGDVLEIPSVKDVAIPPYAPYRSLDQLPHFEQSDLPVTRLIQSILRNYDE